jgi:hypothetical protein
MMTLIPSFQDLLQGFTAAMTAPTFQTWVWVATGWVFTRRRTITGALVAADLVGRKHHSAFHRLFASARWSLDGVGLILFRLLLPWLGEGPVLLALDDTLARKRGLKIFGVGMHHDPLLSSRNKAITNWGHSWVILGIIVRFPLWPERPFCVPILFRLYLNKKAAARHRRAYRTRPELAVEMLTLMCQTHADRRFHAIADSAYGGQNVLKALPANADLTSRLVMDARLHAAAPQPTPGQKGRPRVRGERLPTPAQMLEERAERLTLAIYGRQDRARVNTALACVFAVPGRLLRIVAVEPLTGGRKPQAFYSTCANASAAHVLTWYALRWSIEVAFHDGKQHLGFEDPQGWTRRAVERTAPMAFLMYGLVIVWFIKEGHRHYQAPQRPWYTSKREASFADMLATLRRTSVRQNIFALGLQGRGSRKIRKTLENAVSFAA